MLTELINKVEALAFSATQSAIRDSVIGAGRHQDAALAANLFACAAALREMENRRG